MKALYSGTSNRALYSGTSNRALYGDKITVETQVFFNSVKSVYIASRVDREMGDMGTRSDIYPWALSNLSWDWKSGGTNYAKTYWFPAVTGVGLYYTIYAFCLDTSSRRGQVLKVVRKYTASDVDDYWRRNPGGGRPMFSVRPSSSTTPGSSLSWVGGSHRRSILDFRKSDYSLLRSDITLDSYLWICVYVEGLEPPTENWLEVIVRTGSFNYFM